MAIWLGRRSISVWTSAQLILIRGRIAWGGFFTGDKLIWHRPVWSKIVGGCSHVDAVIDVIDAYCASVTRNAFQWTTHPKILALPLRYLIHGFSGPPGCTLQSASRSVQPYLHGSRTWPTNTETHRRTDHATPSVATGAAAMRPKTIVWTTHALTLIAHFDNCVCAVWTQHYSLPLQQRTRNCNYRPASSSRGLPWGWVAPRWAGPGVPRGRHAARCRTCGARSSPCRPSWWRCRARWGTWVSGYLACSVPRRRRSCPSDPYRPSRPDNNAPRHHLRYVDRKRRVQQNSTFKISIVFITGWTIIILTCTCTCRLTDSEAVALNARICKRWLKLTIKTSQHVFCTPPCRFRRQENKSTC